MILETKESNLFALLQRDKQSISHAKSILFAQLSHDLDESSKEEMVRNYTDYLIDVGEQNDQKRNIMIIFNVIKNNICLVLKIFLYLLLISLFLVLTFDFFNYVWDSFFRFSA